MDAAWQRFSLLGDKNSLTIAYLCMQILSFTGPIREAMEFIVPYQKAIKSFTRAIELSPNLESATQGLEAAKRNLKYRGGNFKISAKELQEYIDQATGVIKEGNKDSNVEELSEEELLAQVDADDDQDEDQDEDDWEDQDPDEDWGDDYHDEL